MAALLLAAAAAAPPTEYLFLNESLVQASSGVRFTMHPPTLAEEPAIIPSTPWEAYGLAAVQVVEWAEGDKRLYYSCRELLPGRNAKGEQNVASRLCLAKSADGKV